jgi:hypothetical protein
VLAQLGHAAVHEVAGDRDRIGAEPVDCLDDALDVRALDRRADMDVAELRDREAFERRRQAAGSERRRASRSRCGAH